MTVLDLGRAAAAMRRGIDDGYHTGAQLAVVTRDGVTADVAVGEARPGVAMTPQTLLAWFSTTKTITAVAVLQLWERGALALDQRVAEWIPEFASGGKESVTIRHLLTHTGGFPHVDESAAPAVWTWENALEAVCRTPLVEGWTPGERAAYHPQSAFHVLGEIVTRAAGRRFDAYVAEEIFEPLDMGDAWLALTEPRYASYGDAMGWMWAPGPNGLEPIERLCRAEGYELVWPSGSGVGPARDLVKVYEMLLRGASAAVSASSRRRRPRP